MKYLITGGTGSFGTAFIQKALQNKTTEKIIVYSRDEYKQYNQKKTFTDDRMRYFIGDVRDQGRLQRAMEGVDIVIHAAALKQVDTIEYNPLEAIKTNIIGAMNVIDSALNCGVKKVIALSTDKATSPVNLYGATKMTSDKLFLSANAYSQHNTMFSIVRYGNVANSRGSVIPYFKSLKNQGAVKLPVTDAAMTRFYITLDEAVETVEYCIDHMRGGETFIKKIPSFKITDLCKALESEWEVVGIREGEKIHEVMTTEHDNIYDAGKYYCIYPNYDWYLLSDYLNPEYKKVDRFVYSSDVNVFMSVEELKAALSV